MSAIFACACRDLAELGEILSRPADELLELNAYARRFSDGVLRAWDTDQRLALDLDVRAAERIRVETCAGLSPLLLPELEPALLGQVVERLQGPGLCRRGRAGVSRRAEHGARFARFFRTRVLARPGVAGGELALVVRPAAARPARGGRQPANRQPGVAGSARGPVRRILRSLYRRTARLPRTVLDRRGCAGLAFR